MGWYKWKLWRLAWGYDAMCNSVVANGLEWKRIIWKLFVAFPKKRVNRAAIDYSLECEWCHEIKRTTINEIWCEKDPSGYLVRLCDDCLSCCAGG